MTGHVVALHVSPARGIAMRAVDTVTAHAGGGLDGDRYRNSRHRHVSVQSLDDLERASTDFGAPIDPALTRRNITVRGIELPTKPGEQLTIADVELEVVRIAAPCRLLDDDIGDGARVALRRRAGTIFRVNAGGTIEIGSPVHLTTQLA